jgi:hypothetical protein
LKPPFYILRFKNWVKLDSENFGAAEQEAELKFAALDAADRGLTVEEAENIDFRSRVPVKTAVAQYLDFKKSKARKTVTAYRTALTQFADVLADLNVRFFLWHHRRHVASLAFQFFRFLVLGHLADGTLPW